jgi:uncharacterized protein YegL
VANDAYQDPKTAIVDALLRVQVMQDPDGRALILAELAERGFRPDARRYARDRHDIWSIVTACVRQPGALACLGEVLRRVEGDSVAVNEIRQLAGTLDPALGDHRRLAGRTKDEGSAARSLVVSHSTFPSISLDMHRSSLRYGAQLGAGARGRVFEIANGQEFVYKEYTSQSVNGGALAELIIHRQMLPETQREALDARTSWPLARVVDGNRVVGSVMYKISKVFYMADAPDRLAYLSFLCYPRRSSWSNIRLPMIGERLHIVAQIVDLFSSLHQYALVVGDVSAQNILWTCDGTPRVFLLGCDGIRKLGSPPALQEGETPDWQDPMLGAGTPDFQSDRYKLALVVGRILAQDAHVRPGQPLRLLDGIPRHTASSIIESFARAAGPPAERPTAKDWANALTARSSFRVQWPKRTPADWITVLPLYVACDVSESPRGISIDHVNRLVDEAIELAWNPVIVEKVRIAVVTFADDARVVLPLSEFDEITELPILNAGADIRNYSPVFTLLKSLINTDVLQLAEDGYNVMRPWVLFISSGPPSDDWTASYSELVDPADGRRPEIFAWSNGDANEARIAEIGTLAAQEIVAASPAQVLQEVAKTLASSDIHGELRKRLSGGPGPSEPRDDRSISLEYIDEDH